MRRTVALGDGWRLKGYLGEDGALEAARRGWDGPGWVAARVPGSVGADLVRAGEAPNPYVERQSLALEWIAERAWRYATTVDVPSLEDGERATVRFEGVDHRATVLWDGAELARHEGMFTPFDVELPVGSHDGGRPHRLEVVVGPAPETEPQVGRTSQVRVHKSRMTYGWDFCPRLVHQGVWRPVTLELTGRTRVVDLVGRPTFAQGFGSARLDVAVRLETGPGAAVEVAAELRDGERVVATATVTTAAGDGDTGVALSLDVAEPRLWWPNGHGEAVLHRLTVRATERSTGVMLDERVIPVGFRTVRLVENDGARADARGYTFEVNGRRLYATGWNWVPVDLFHGVPRPELEAHLLRLAAEAHVVLLRVWGGGLIESKSFYESCDRLGIMVWQELAQSSSGVESTPSADPAFVDLMAAEARAIIPTRRAHPSLALWCGGNELADDAGPLDERSPVLAAIGDVVRELDPDRSWLPTSPTGPRFHNRIEDIETDPDGLHDVHGPWEHQGLDRHNVLYDRGTSLLNSEFGVEGMANRRTLEALIPAERRWPAGRDNPVYRHLGECWDNEPLVQASFGGRIRDVDRLRRASQHLQADGLRYAIEANRRREARQSGSLPWQLNESFPNAWCTSAVDHRGDPKPAYFAVRRAYEPVHVCARFDRWAWHGEPVSCDVWAWSGLEPLAGGRVVARVCSVDGCVLEEVETRVELGAGRPARVASLGVALPDGLAVLDLSLAAGTGDVVSRNRYVISGTDDLAPLLDLPRARLDVRCAEADDAWILDVRHAGGPAALGVVVDDARPVEAPGWAEASDGGFDLLPGESRRIEVRWADAPAEGRRLRIEGWNVDVAVG